MIETVSERERNSPKIQDEMQMKWDKITNKSDTTSEKTKLDKNPQILQKGIRAVIKQKLLQP